MAGRRRPIASLAAGVPRGGALPHPDYPQVAYKVVLDACRVAWARLQKKMAGIEDATEDAITLGLQGALNQMRLERAPTVRGFNFRAFDRVTRGEAVCDYSGRKPTKSPDLVFRTASTGTPFFLEEHHAIFVECKIVDRAGHPVRLYCTNGVRRFVIGDYAWAMPSGLMLAYARGGCAVADPLVPHLRKHKARSGDRFKTKVLPVEIATKDDPPAWQSRHGRSWRYQGSGARPGPIRLWHLWLDVR